MTAVPRTWWVPLALAAALLGACGPRPSPAPTGTQAPTVATATPAATFAWESCRLGAGLRQDTVTVLAPYKGRLAMIVTQALNVAKGNFDQYQGSMRVLVSPNLAQIQQKIAGAPTSNVPYEALGYDLEAGHNTPVAEYQDLVGSTQKAAALAHQAGKLLLMIPGFKLMSENQSDYPAMAALSDIWVIQTQQLQVNPAGPAYRQAVQQVIALLKQGHPGISIWAQISVTPGKTPLTADEWLAYRSSIVDLVDGAFVYDANDPNEPQTLIPILAGVCGTNP